MKNGLPLKEVLDQLRTEFTALSEKASKEAFQFAVESVDLELKVGVTREATGEAALRFWILEAGGTAKQEIEQTQTVRLRLAPRVGGRDSRAETLIRR